MTLYTVEAPTPTESDEGGMPVSISESTTPDTHTHVHACSRVVLYKRGVQMNDSC